jgi:hypothetical protein
MKGGVDTCLIEGLLVYHRVSTGTVAPTTVTPAASQRLEIAQDIMLTDIIGINSTCQGESFLGGNPLVLGGSVEEEAIFSLTLTLSAARLAPS